MEKNNKKQKNKLIPKKRKWWFTLLKKMMRSRYKCPTFINLGEDILKGGVVLSNHEGTDSPMTLEMYHPANHRMWGTYEMNSGLIKMYKYQTRVYYHEKKHWNLHLARLFCLIASPLTNLFYKGLNLISTYKDARFIKTIRESIAAIENGDNVVVFPEDSTNGYLAELEGFHAGFVVFADTALKKGIDLPVFVTYFNKEKLIYIIDRPINYSEIKAVCNTKEEIADKLRLRCNELGKMTNDETFVSKYINK